MANIFLMASGKGGTGKSSLTALLGRALAGAGRNVLLLELDAGLRCLDLMLGVSERVLYDAGDVLDGRCKPVDAVTVIPVRAGNLHYIAAPVKPAFRPDEAALLRLIAGLGDTYDHVFIDAPAGLGELLGVLARAAGCVLLITHAEPASVRDAAALTALLRRAGAARLRLIINRFSSAQLGAGVPDLDRVIDGVGAQLIGVVPDDPALPAALGTGHPPPDRSPAALAAAALAERLEGRYTPLLATSLK